MVAFIFQIIYYDFMKVKPARKRMKQINSLLDDVVEMENNCPDLHCYPSFNNHD